MIDRHPDHCKRLAKELLTRESPRTGEYELKTKGYNMKRVLIPQPGVAMR